jgi:threonyl-tRNA synthetase
MTFKPIFSFYPYLLLLINMNVNIQAQRHSLAHIMATAIKRHWPEAKFGVGPAIDNGFYYDIDLGPLKLSTDDFATIEKEMNHIIESNVEFEHFELDIDSAIQWASEANQPYKLELLNDLKRTGTTDFKNLDVKELGIESSNNDAIEKVSFYRNDDFTDLCRGPHVKKTGDVGKFKLIRISGAYWRGLETNPQMQRIYGAAFETKEELNNYINTLNEAKKNDHRKLGHELDLFLISPLVGAGLPLFTPRGTILRDELNRYSQEVRKKIGFQNVWTPHIAKQELYEVSGHWAKFGDQWLTVDSKETKDKLVLKPMNCPHHQQIYASKARSYRDLPINYMETTTDYRDEKAGELLGLSRVRSLTQDDSHTFCTPEQIEQCISSLVEKVKEFYGTLGMNLRARLSFRDESDKYLGSKELWDNAQSILKTIVEKSGLEYFIGEGEAAFYGPKIDFMGMDAMGREWQLATPQLDFIQPQRFGLTYTAEDGQEKTPVMIHFAIMGSIERFLSAYIEHSKGRFPVWLAPEQIRVITVNQEQTTIEFADKLKNEALNLNLRIEIDNSNESVGKKIRSAEIMKIPYTIVVGEKEIASGEINPRIREDLKTKNDQQIFKIDAFLKKVAEETAIRSSKSTL